MASHLLYDRPVNNFDWLQLSSIKPFHCNNQSLYRTNNDIKIMFKKYCLNVTIYVKPDKRDEFIQVMSQNAAGTRTEPLNIQFTWGESQSTPNVFHIQEQFVSKEAVDAHVKTEHFLKWAAFASDSDSPFEKPYEIYAFEEI